MKRIQKKSLKIVIPKGRIFQNVVSLFHEAGFRLETDARGYTPWISDPEIEVKCMKPQNIAQLVVLGSHDLGFTGFDWIVETGAEVREIIDLKFDPVKIVAAIPQNRTPADLKKRRIVVASEYENVSRRYLDRRGFDYLFLRTFGATEVFPPDDADMIIDNVSSGRTLKANSLKIIDTLMSSSTRLIANPAAAADSWKGEKIAELTTLFLAVLDARERVMLEMNVPPEKLAQVVKKLPCMRSPTVSPLYRDQGYAVKVAVKRTDVVRLIPMLKRMGATDILEYEIRKVVI
jgi:ATP phosphoribosyltransferase